MLPRSHACFQHQHRYIPEGRTGVRQIFALLILGKDAGLLVVLSQHFRCCLADGIPQWQIGFDGVIEHCPQARQFAVHGGRPESLFRLNTLVSLTTHRLELRRSRRLVTFHLPALRPLLTFG